VAQFVRCDQGRSGQDQNVRKREATVPNTFGKRSGTHGHRTYPRRQILSVRYKLSAKLLIGGAYMALGALAIAAGVWGG